MGTQTTNKEKRPKVLFFDVNETLLDLNGMRQSVTDALGGKEALFSLWFTSMLHYSLVATSMDDYRDFGEIGVATMMMVARSQGIQLAQEDAKKAVQPIRSLPPHQDVRESLAELNVHGFRMATLTNSSGETMREQISNAGLTEMFEQLLSIDAIAMYKPHSHTYRWAARQMEVAPHECMLIAAHGWDVAGAIAAGLRAAFVSRPGQQLYPLAPEPEIIGQDLNNIAGKLLKMKQ